MRTCAGFHQKLSSAAALFFGNAHGNERFIGKRINPACTAKEFQIVKLLVCRDLTGLGNGHRLRKQKTAAISGVADAFRNIRSPGEPGGVKRVLEQDGNVEFLRTKFVRQPLASGNANVDAVRVVVDELIADLLVTIDVGNVRAGHNRDLRVGKACAHGTQRRQGHNRVADPVRGTNQNLHAAAPVFGCNVWSRAFLKSASGLTTRSITET